MLTCKEGSSTEQYLLKEKCRDHKLGGIKTWNTRTVLTAINSIICWFYVYICQSMVLIPSKKEYSWKHSSEISFVSKSGLRERKQWNVCFFKWKNWNPSWHSCTIVGFKVVLKVPLEQIQELKNVLPRVELKNATFMYKHLGYKHTLSRKYCRTFTRERKLWELFISDWMPLF